MWRFTCFKSSLFGGTGIWTDGARLPECIDQIQLESVALSDFIECVHTIYSRQQQMKPAMTLLASVPQ